MLDEGLHIARLAALELVDGLNLLGAPSPIQEALDTLHLQQTIVSRQPDLPYPDVPKNVRGILDAREAAIYVIADKEARQRWIGGHEIGHFAIREHNAILQFCSEWDLSPAARERLEREANEFTATYLFQGSRFLDECLQLPFSLEMLKDQAMRWGVSIEAAFRRFAEGHPEPVALLVCTPIELVPGGVDIAPGRTRITLRPSSCSGVKLRYIAPSARYRRERPHLKVGQVLNGDHPISKAVAARDSYDWLTIRNHPDPVPASIFFNGYDVLVLLGPQNSHHRLRQSAVS
jgi:IrrE N-terminal-like domain